MKHLTVLRYRFSNQEEKGINPHYHYFRTFESGADAEKWFKNFVATCGETLDYHSFNKELANV
jgi:hypothetical protein